MLPSQVVAWGQEGHSIVAEIAQRRLDAGTFANVQGLLASGTPSLSNTVVSLSSIASWAVAAELKERIERRFGVADTWVLGPGAKEFSLPGDALGPEYVLMSQVLEREDGLGALDLVYFNGPFDFTIHFGLDGQNDLGKLDVAYDDLVKTDPRISAAADKRSFRDYYGLRASVADSLGFQGEWDIVRTIIETRRLSDPTVGIARQMGVWFDGKPTASGLLETPVATGDVGKRGSNNEQGKAK